MADIYTTAPNGAQTRITTNENDEPTEMMIMTETRLLHMRKGFKSGLWSVSLDKRSWDAYGFLEQRNLRTYVNMTHAEAMAYWDKKDKQFNK